MSVMVRDLPKEVRPREKLLQCGASALSDIELLAILLRTGTTSKSVLHLAEDVLAQYKDKGLAAVIHMSPQEIASIHGVGLAKAATVVAAVELGRRLSERAAQTIDKVEGPEDVARYVIPSLRFEQKEHFLAMFLDIRNRILALSTISVGSLTASIAHPREVFREAIRYSAAGVILVHNHPSGDPAPSREDIQLTKQMMKAGEIMGIPVLDHVVVAGDNFLSLKEANCL
ncbi:MAG: JAB domain-containing protein [Schwartzia succinivorans]|nr:JAB domain-containing protein [Schwartzia succinivorans]